MKKIIYLAVTFALSLCIFTGCGKEEKLYDTLSFLSEEQSRLMLNSYEINLASASPSKYVSHVSLVSADKDPCYISQDGTLYILTDALWDDFLLGARETFTENYLDILQANGLYTKMQGKVAVACINQKINNPALNSILRYRLIEKSDDRIVFEQLRLHFLRRDGEGYEDFTKRMEKCKDYDNLSVSSFTFVNTENGWRVDNFNRCCGSEDNLSAVFPQDIHTTDTDYIPLVLDAYFPQNPKIFEPLLLEAENIGRAIISSVDTVSEDITTPEYNLPAFLMYLCEWEDKPHYPYYNFAYPAGGGMRSFDAEVCRTILKEVTGSEYTDADMFDDRYHFDPETDTYFACVKDFEPTPYTTQTAYMHKIYDSGLDCRITHYVWKLMENGEDYEQIGLGQFNFKLNTATNHWQFDRFEYTHLF